MVTVVDYLAEQLVEANVTTVYGLPGGENVEIMEAIRKQGIEFVLVKNESSACFMAATHARLTGTLGVALTTLGPGATNAYVGLAHAFLDRAPVLLITAQTDPYLIGTHTHQVIDLQASFSPITKFTAELDVETAQSTIQHAIHMTTSGRLGPVHLGINNRVALQQLSSVSQIENMLDSPDPDLTEIVKDIQTLISGKEKPVFVVGLGLEKDKPYSQTQELAEALDAPVIDTPKSKGAFPARHPLYAGTIGLTRTDPVYDVLDEADCIIAVGFDVVELVKPWDQKQPLIWIANWANQDPRIPCDVEYVGNIVTLLDELIKYLASSSNSGWGEKQVAQFRNQQNAVSSPAPKPNTLLPQTVLEVIRDNTPDDITITTDVGSHKIFTALNWQALEPNRYFVSNGLSAMGFGLTSAITASKITGKPTICITGDAGLAMVVGELALLADYQLPVIVVVMNDSALDLIRSAQKRRNRPVFGTEFSNPNYKLLAGAYRLDYAHVETREHCEQAIQSALESKSPTLVEVMIDPIGYPTTVKSTGD